MNKTIDSNVSEANESEGFYSRWSKNKLQSQNNHHAEANMPVTGDISADIIIDKGELSELNQESVLLCDKDMPEIDSLDDDSDYSGFLSPGVSDELRKLALHKLFHGQSFNLCDGLDDYDEEFTSFEKLGDIVTADMRFQLEEEAKRKLQIAAQEDEISAKNNEIALQDEVCPEDEINESIHTPMADDTADQEEHVLPDNENLS